MLTVVQSGIMVLGIILTFFFILPYTTFSTTKNVILL